MSALGLSPWPGPPDRPARSPRHVRSCSPSSTALEVLCVLVLVAGCGGDGLAGPGGDNPESSGPSAALATLECEKMGYPCSLADVPLEILEHSEALGDSVERRMDEGSTSAQVVAWLQTLPDMAEVQGNERTIRFRLDGGRGYWVLLDDDVDQGPTLSRLGPLQKPRAGSSAEARYDVVGPGKEHKEALVLAPVLWEFQQWDDAPLIDAIMRDTRGYEGGVRFMSNADTLSTEVDVETFKGWGKYQVVYVNSHGRRVCDAKGCRAMIVATNLRAVVAGGTETPAEAAKRLTAQGLEVSKPREGDDRRPRYVSVTADFFRANYETGIDDAIIFFNACETYGSQATDLVDAIRGSRSVIFGWDEAVHADEAASAAVALFTELSKWGYPAGVAYDNVGALKHGSATEHGPAPTLIMGERSTGGDLRIRDVVTLLEPTSGAKLTPSSVVGIVGVKADGEDDEAPWRVLVEGMKPEVAAQATLHVEVDGVEGDPVPVSDGTIGEHDAWTVSGTVPLGYDLDEAKSVTFRAWVDLPDQGKSEQETAATLSGDDPIMGRTWEFKATNVVSYTEAGYTSRSSTADLILTFAPGQGPSEPHPRYVITGGTVTFDFNHSTPSCTFQAPVLTFDVTEEIARDSWLTFDATQRPALYSGALATVGPEFTATVQCGSDYTSMQQETATTVWLVLNPGEERPVSSDNRSFSGVYRTETVLTPNNTFIVETTYTATRID